MQKKGKLRSMWISLGIIIGLIVLVAVVAFIVIRTLMSQGVLTIMDIMSTVQLAGKYFIPLGILLLLIIIGIVAFHNRSNRFNFWFKWESLLAFIGVLILTVNVVMLGPMAALLSVQQADLAPVNSRILHRSANVDEDIAGEGAVLLKNNDNVLPFDGQKNVNIFGWASTNPLYGGTGSGGVGAIKQINLYQGMENAGFKPNMQLYNFYRHYRKSRPVVSMMQQDWTLPEPKASTYSNKMMNHAKKYSKNAVVVLSRSGGEGADLPKDMTNLPKGATYKGNKGDFKKGQDYLSIDKSERQMLNKVNKNFKNVVVVVNSANPMQLGFLNQYSHVKGAIWMPGPGQQGFNALGKIIRGKTNPSGRLVDTYLYNDKNSPSNNNFGDFQYANGKQAYNSGNKGMTFVNYSEGIYVGYKYFETRYGSNNSQYNKIVQYPFGYGLSYTRFRQSMSQLHQGANGKITYTVTVRNTGRRAGKDVVQTYYTAPYKNGGIEKASTNLLRFAKTKNLQPGQSQRLHFTVNRADMASYDQKLGRYVLDSGNYQVQLKNNSHSVVATRQFNLGNRVVYSKLPGDKQNTKNEFQSAKGNVTYLSRRDNFANANKALAVPSKNIKAPKSVLKNATVPKNEKVPKATGKMPTTKAHNNIKLAQLRGKSYDNPMWNKLLDEMSVKDMQKLVTYGGYQTTAIRSIGKRQTYDFDGPSGLSSLIIRGLKTTTFPAADLTAATWNAQLANDKGQQVGREGQAAGISGWYGPAMNIHRNPFGGRTFEYYSEDPQIAGTMAANEIKGAKKYGVYSYMKHFAMNNQETNRMNAINEWANEQSIRETYLKPFRMAVEDGHAMATMNSFNFIGDRWAGGNSNLMKNVLRGEWGYKGFAETDYFAGGYMNSNTALANGTDLMLSTNGAMGAKPQGTNNPTVVRQMRTASHHILYTVVNSSAYSKQAVKSANAVTLPWKKRLYVIDTVLVIILVLLECLLAYVDKRKYRD